MPVPTRSPVRKALSIAVQYASLSQFNMDLAGTHNDSKILSDLLVEVYNYKREDIAILMDDDSGDHPPPTRENIERAMRDLITGAQPGDHFVFHFSGHGAQVPNEDGTEKSGFDDVIWPLDVKYNEDGSFDNFVKDDEIHDVLVEHVPVGAHFMMVFDCCHSGTMADLPNDSDDPVPLTPVTPASSTLSTISTTQNLKSIRVRGSHDVATPEGTERKTTKESFESDAPLPHHLDPAVADVTSWGACQDSQVTLGGRRGGVFINALASALKQHPDANHALLLTTVTREIAKITAKINAHKHSGDDDYEAPRPELESLHPMDEVMNMPLDI